ncbi:MAG: HAD family hydrolase [Chloroflexota bacterium]
MYKLVAVDLDDTLIRNDWKVSDRTVETLFRWRAERGPVVIATGRPPRMTRKIREELHGLPWICYNGAIALEEGQAIYRNEIQPDVLRPIVSLLLEEAPDDWIGLEIDDILYMSQPLENKSDALHVDELLAYADQPSAKILLSRETFHTFHERHPDLFAQTQPLVSDRVSMVQIQAQNASKGTALATLVPGWGYTMQNVVAFGDDVNDVEMIRDSGMGVAVENAVDEVKAVANRITASNHDEGVALVLEELLNKV